MLFSKIVVKNKLAIGKTIFIFALLVNISYAQDKDYRFEYLSPKNDTLITSIEQKLEAQLNSINNRKYKSEIKKIFKERYENYLNWIEDSTFVYNTKVSSYLNSILQNIYRANPNLEPSEFNFFLNKSLIPNAACFGDKNFMINLGLFTFLDNEDELAFILCHEIAHYQLDHVNSNIIRFIEKANDNSTKQKVRKIKNLRYGKNTTGLEFLKNITFNFLNHSRKFEIEADSLGFLLFKNTKYNQYGAVKCLEKLDSIEDQYFKDSIDLKKRFNFKNYAFKNSWLEKEQTLFNIDEKIDDYEWNKDSLKTHPDAKLRAELIAKIAKNNGINSIKDFSLLQDQLNYQLIDLLIDFKKIDIALYIILKQFENKEKTEEFYVVKMAELLAELYDLRKNHQLGKYVSPVSSITKEKNLNQIRQFLHNLELKNIRKIGYNFCLKYEAEIINNEDFTNTFTKFKTLNTK